MKVTLFGPILLALSAYGQLAFLENMTAVCTVTMDLKLCEFLPIFSNGCVKRNTIPANLTRFYYAKDLETTSPDRYNTLKYIVARRIQYQVAYNENDRSIELQLRADQCCKHPKAFINIKYLRQRPTDSCPTLSYGKPGQPLGCIPLMLGLFNVMFVNNLVLIRGQSFTLLLSSDQFLDRINADQLEWFERLIEFGMWSGVDILQESPPESCTCSTLKEFEEWYERCKLANLIESNQSLPLYNMTKESKVAQEMGLSTMEQWIILGVVCGIMMLVGVIIES